MPNDETYLSTGIKTLDRLLGGKGFRRGSTALIRGRPGTGKTTLAFQIALSVLKKEEQNALFISLEETPDVALGRIYQALGLGRSRRLGERGGWGEHSTWLGDRLRMLGPAEFWPPFPNSDFPTCLHEFWENNHRPDHGRPTLVVIDGVTALVHGAKAKDDFSPASERRILFDVIQSFDLFYGGTGPRPTLILTAEDRANLADDDQAVISSPAGESYLADAVVQLRSKQMKQLTTIGNGQDVHWTEDLLFCRVLKTRGLAGQRRSSCYEFVKGEGIKFFPTYAAQGFVSLFYENIPQLRFIREFANVDVPFSYPGLIVHNFTRSGLQRMFAVRRRARRIPPRRPMILSSVDEYWVDVLGSAGMLHPLPSKAIRLFSLPIVEPGKAGGTWIIPELSRKRNGPCYLEKSRRDATAGTDDGPPRFLALPYIGNVGMMVYRRDLLKAAGHTAPPETWEELVELCSEFRREGSPYQFLIETNTYDTLMATALELGWANGAHWRTEKQEGGGTAIDCPEDVFDRFCEAIEFLKKCIFSYKIMPPRSSVDPDYNRSTNWAFSRHWYSTWIDVWTARDREGEPIAPSGDGQAYGVCRIPIFHRYKEAQELDRKGGSCRHHSAWGEWYLAIQSNSENIELGIDLLNNLLTSRKIVDLALSGAALPLVEKAYQTYGDAICYGTDKTFTQMRKMLFANARSRTEFYNYRKVGRVLYGALNVIVTNRNANVRRLLEGAFREIDPRFPSR
jgi:hypothetical protein